MKKNLNGLDITYRYHKGILDKTILLLHGWGGSLNSFRTLERDLTNEGFSVITLDFPGFGGSQMPREDFELHDYYLIVSELLKTENISKVSIVAHSFGGRVAIMFASKEPEHLDKLILVDSAGIKSRFNLFKQFKIWHYKFLKKLKKIGIIKRELSNYGSSDYKAMPKELKPVFNRIVTLDLTPNLKDIQSPTLIIWGRDDKDTPYYMAKKLNKNIKDSAIITFEGGHFAYLDYAERFSIIVKEFVK